MPTTYSVQPSSSSSSLINLPVGLRKHRSLLYSRQRNLTNLPAQSSTFLQSTRLARPTKKAPSATLLTRSSLPSLCSSLRARLTAMDLLGQLRQGISKAVQKATDNQISIYHDFPECTLLNNTDRLSIKLSDPGIHHTLVNQWRPEPAEINHVAFTIRDEDNHKQPVMMAQLQAGSGLLLKDMSGRAIMVVRPPQQSMDSIGKLMHPAPATLYKIMRVPGTMNYSVVKSPSGEAVFQIEKVLVSLYPIGKAVGLLGTNCVYLMKRLDGVILGYIRPKLVVKSNTLVVKFTSTQRTLQVRETILGAALLFMITEVYPNIKMLLEESMKSPSLYPSLSNHA